MIVEYNRPETLPEALALLSRPNPVSIPLAGGTTIDRSAPQELAVVDLQRLGLSGIRQRGSLLEIGATTTLASLLETEGLQPDLLVALQHEATHNLRQAATVAGTLVAASGRSPLAAVFLALDAALELKGLSVSGGEAVESRTVPLGELYSLRAETLRGWIITQVKIPLNARLAYRYVARTPADLPIVCAALAQWPGGRTRLALGGYGSAPRLALDGPEPGGVEIAAADAYSRAGDEWASAEYRQAIAGVLAKRCLEEMV